MGCYKNIIDSLRLCGNGDDPVDECGQVDCVCHYGERDSMCRQKVMFEAADAIEELLAELATIRNQLPRWVSVEERMPHYLDHVLCVNKFDIQMVGYLTDYKEGGFRCESGMDSCDYITHWMPLPEPPKGVE